MNKKHFSSIMTKDIITKNKIHDNLVYEILSKTEYKDIKGLIDYFKEEIDCSIVNEYKENLDKSLKNIVLIAQITKIQSNYKKNIEIILGSNKISFNDYMQKIDLEIENGLELSIKPFNVLLSKTKSKEEIIFILDKYKDKFSDLDEVVFLTIARRLDKLEDIIDIYQKYLIQNGENGENGENKINVKTLNILLYKSETPEKRNNILLQYGKNVNFNIKTINILLKNTTTLNEGLELLSKYNLETEINTETINNLILKSKNEDEIKYIFGLASTDIIFNLDTIAALLYRTFKISDIGQYLIYFNDESIIKIKDKNKFIKNYFLNKILNKYNNIIDIEDLYENIIKLINQNYNSEINESNWNNFI